MQKIHFTAHAKRRMTERNICISRIMDILDYGTRAAIGENKYKYICGSYVIIAKITQNIIKIITVIYVSRLQKIICKIAQKHKVNIYKATQIYLQKVS